MAKVLSYEEIIEILKQFDEKWEIEDNGKKLKKEFKFKSFIEAFSITGCNSSTGSIRSPTVNVSFFPKFPDG